MKFFISDKDGVEHYEREEDDSKNQVDTWQLGVYRTWFNKYPLHSKEGENHKIECDKQNDKYRAV